MAVSDQLAKLSTRARQAETRGAAARDKAPAELEEEVAGARTSAQTSAQRMRERADAQRGEMSDRWTDLHDTWDGHVAATRQRIDDRRERRERDKAFRRADEAEADASYAVDYAYAAIEEAEYAVLDAVLSRMEADELATTSDAAT